MDGGNTSPLDQRCTSQKHVGPYVNQSNHKRCRKVDKLPDHRMRSNSSAPSNSDEYRHSRRKGQSSPVSSNTNGEHGFDGDEIQSVQKETPSHKYRRRSRHKTRSDKYDYKMNFGEVRALEQTQVATKKRRSKRKKNGIALNEEFQARNVDSDRLTLARKGTIGLFNRGKLSLPKEHCDLPDLTFAEIAFLSEGPKERGARSKEPVHKVPSRDKDRQEAHKITTYFSCSDGIREASLNRTSAQKVQKKIVHGAFTAHGFSGSRPDSERSSSVPTDCPQRPSKLANQKQPVVQPLCRDVRCYRSDAALERSMSSPSRISGVSDPNPSMFLPRLETRARSDPEREHVLLARKCSPLEEYTMTAVIGDLPGRWRHLQEARNRKSTYTLEGLHALANSERENLGHGSNAVDTEQRPEKHQSQEPGISEHQRQAQVEYLDSSVRDLRQVVAGFATTGRCDSNRDNRQTPQQPIHTDGRQPIHSSLTTNCVLHLQTNDRSRAASEEMIQRPITSRTRPQDSKLTESYYGQYTDRRSRQQFSRDGNWCFHAGHKPDMAFCTDWDVDRTCERRLEAPPMRTTAGWDPPLALDRRARGSSTLSAPHLDELDVSESMWAADLRDSGARGSTDVPQTCVARALIRDRVASSNLDGSAVTRAAFDERVDGTEDSYWVRKRSNQCPFSQAVIPRTWHLLPRQERFNDQSVRISSNQGFCY